jgi:hypothetical protein
MQVARWDGRMWRAFAVLVLLLLAESPLRAEPAGRGWERLPDGSVVIDIYGSRLAFPPDLRPGLVVFRHGPRDVPLHEVIARPEEMRRWWAPSDPTMPVGIALAPSLVAPLLFEGPAAVDRTAVSAWSPFQLWVYRQYDRTHCAFTTIDRQICPFFIERARDEAAIGANGFIVERPAMLPGAGKTDYLFPERERRAAPGDPARIACRELPRSLWCMNGTALQWGTFIRPGIVLRYQYSMSRTNPQDMRAIDTAFRTVVEGLLLDEAPATR